MDAHRVEVESLRLLIIEDNPTDAFLATEALRRSGRWSTQVIVGKSLAAAEQHLADPSLPLDLVLLDMRLPDGEGLDALGRVLLHRPDVAVLVLTGLDDDRLARACLEAGATDYVQKSSILTREFTRSVEFAVARSHNRRLEAQLDQVSRLASLGRVAAGVAHEINNPATYIGLNVAEVHERLLALSEGTGDLEVLPALAKRLKTALEGVDRIRTVVQQLSDYARGDEEGVNVVEDPVKTCQTSLRMVHHQVRHRAMLETSFSECPPIAMNPQRFAQVLTNLVLNAAEAAVGAPMENTVTVRLTVVDTAAELVVEDRGQGIPNADLDRIFDTFFTTKRDSGGTGLGLALCRDLVSSVGGTIAVESEVDVGTTFRVRLPLVSVAPQVLPAAPDAPLRRARVLLVDDDPAVLEAIELGLSRHHEVHAVPSGEAALERIEALEGAVDVVLCDMMLGGIDGATTLGKLFAAYPSLRSRSCILSGGATTANSIRFIKSAGVRFLPKPTSLSQLLQAIAETMERNDSVG